MTFSFLPDAVKDAEIENWAAKKIQSSFKQYKYHKTLSKDVDDGGRLADCTGPRGSATAATGAVETY